MRIARGACFTVIVVSVAFLARAEELSLCRFDAQKLSFAGSAVEQAKCLLRKVEKKADLGENLTSLPKSLDGLIGRDVTITKPALRKYLAARKIEEGDIGGSLDKPVTRARSNAPDAPLATYFVIHDTSTPNCSKPKNKCAQLGVLPKNRDDASWPYNKEKLLLRYKDGTPIAHVFVGRIGISKTGVDFSEPWRAIQLEKATPGFPARGLFLHIENVQPRVGEPAIPKKGVDPNDRIAPVPGFTAVQYERLAVIYVAASVRRGQWMIPAFHAVLDKGVGTHDDPQNFDLDAWAQALGRVIAAIGQ